MAARIIKNAGHKTWGPVWPTSLYIGYMTLFMYLVTKKVLDHSTLMRIGSTCNDYDPGPILSDFEHITISLYVRNSVLKRNQNQSGKKGNSWGFGKVRILHRNKHNYTKSRKQHYHFSKFQ